MIGNHVYRQRYRGFESRPLRRTARRSPGRWVSFAFLTALFGLLAFGCAGERREASPRTPSAASDIFRFHVGLWANLHQVLVHESLLPKPGFEGPKSLAHESVAKIADLAPSELAPWRDALGYYDKRFTTHNTFTDEFME